MDPSTFLSALTGTTAALVAIIGGLLVARFIGLDSEQQGAQRVLEHAEDRLALARKQASEAEEALRGFLANDFLDDRDVLELIQEGVTDLRKLRLEGGDVDLDDDELRPFVEEIAAEFRKAKDFFGKELAASDALSYDEWKEVPGWWDFRKHAEGLPETDYSQVWELAYDEAIAARTEEAKKREPKRGSVLGVDFLRVEMPGIPPVTIPRGIGPAHVQRRARLQSAYDRAQQSVEDLEAEAQRLRDARDEVVRPDRQLWIGLGILLYPTIVGIVVPVVAMSEGPSKFTPGITNLIWPFFSGLLVLVAYMIYLAARLSRRSKNTSAKS